MERGGRGDGGCHRGGVEGAGDGDAPAPGPDRAGAGRIGFVPNGFPDGGMYLPGALDRAPGSGDHPDPEVSALAERIPHVWRQTCSWAALIAHGWRQKRRMDPSVRLDDLRVSVEDFPQIARRLHPMLLHRLEQAEDVPHARQRDSLLAGQVLDDVDLSDVPLRASASG